MQPRVSVTDMSVQNYQNMNQSNSSLKPPELVGGAVGGAANSGVAHHRKPSLAPLTCTNTISTRPRLSLSLSSYTEHNYVTGPGSAGSRSGSSSPQILLMHTRKLSQLVAEKIPRNWRIGGGVDDAWVHREIVDQAKNLCGRYLRSKLRACAVANKKLGLQRLRSVSRLTNATGSPVTQETVTAVGAQLKLLCQQLERAHPKLFHTVLGNVGLYILSSPCAVDHLLQNIARELFRNDITWGRIVALFTLTGALANDCVRVGHPEFVLTLVESLGTFVDRDLAQWIMQQGGWVVLLASCKKTAWDLPTVLLLITLVTIPLLTLSIIWKFTYHL